MDTNMRGLFAIACVALTCSLAIGALARGHGSSDDSGDMPVHLLELESRVYDLQERVYQSKRRIQVLQVHIIDGTIMADTRLVIMHHNDIGPFSLERAVYYLDGELIFNREGDDLLSRDRFEILNSDIEPGEHELKLSLQYQGDGLPYMEGYEVTIESKQSFTVDKGLKVVVNVIAYQSGDITTKIEDRPAVRYDIEVVRPGGKQAALSPM